MAQAATASTTPAPITLDAYRAMVGTEIGTSRWFEIDQARIDGFADLTEDWQFIHVDPKAAASTPFGGTIAHGYLTLAMLSAMAYDAVPPVIGGTTSLNYGFNKLRFLSPVAAGKRIRGRFKLANVSEHGSNAIQTLFAVTVEIEGQSKPALVAEWVTLQFFGGV